MEIPFDYITLRIFEELMIRDMEPKIKISSLRKYFNFFIKDLIEECQLGIKDISFDFNTEFNFFISNYNYYISIENNYLVFDSNYQDELGLDVDKLISENPFTYIIDNITNSKIEYLTLIEVNIRKDIHACLVKSTKECEKLYNTADTRKRGIKRQIGINLLRNMIVTSEINNLPLSDYYDLMQYSEEYENYFSQEENIPFKNLNNYGSFFFEDSFEKALYGINELYTDVICDMLELNKLNNTNKYSSKENFYFLFLYLLNREINNVNNYELKKELIIAKKRLTYVLDMVYGTISFTKKNKIGIYVYNDCKFIKGKIYYLTNELLSYEDSDYENRNKTTNIDVYFYNVIKKLYIETYYQITNDPLVEDIIKYNFNYKTNKISSAMVDSAISNRVNKYKIKRK